MLKRATGAMLAITMLTIGNLPASAAQDAAKSAAKLTEATSVYHELISTADQAVPKELLEGCKCVAVLPGVIKAAVGYGARHGGGVISCRTANGWSAPAFVNISGGSVGLQLGASSTDLVLFFMNEGTAKSLVNSSRFTLGGKASVAAGPFGRTGEAATNLDLKSQIYSYARTKGLFAGLSIEGARLGPANEETAAYYGRGVTYKQLLLGNGPATIPAEAETFRSSLP